MFDLFLHTFFIKALSHRNFLAPTMHRTIPTFGSEKPLILRSLMHLIFPLEQSSVFNLQEFGLSLEEIEIANLGLLEPRDGVFVDFWVER